MTVFWPRPRFRPSAGHAEIGVLVGQFAVAGIVGRFRDAPRHVLRAAVLDLALDDQIAGLVEDAALRLLHHQRRHQIFEHRARPGHQRAAGSRSRRSAGRAGTSARSAGRPWRWRTGWSAAPRRREGRSSFRRAGAPRRGSRSTAACAPCRIRKEKSISKAISARALAQTTRRLARSASTALVVAVRVVRHAPRRWPPAAPPSRR